ncbi:hypothetical protein [Sorangium sp. So ce1000]|uniref:hypothetical protein n=1 Tax=Sorangium sp. So ce1000 TaxID=3133325 RepID=UPI003F60EED3
MSDEAAKAGMIDLYRFYRSGAGGVVTSAVKDVTGREPIGFERFAEDHAAALRRSGARRSACLLGFVARQAGSRRRPSRRVARRKGLLTGLVHDIIHGHGWRDPRRGSPRALLLGRARLVAWLSRPDPGRPRLRMPHDASSADGHCASQPRWQAPAPR